MTGIHTIADADEVCSTDIDIARWLLTAPRATLLRDELEIRRWLRARRFPSGLSYLSDELDGLRAARRIDGTPVNGMAIDVACGRLFRIACGLPPRNLGD